ncbi:MAG TPA: RNA polymerase sigma factor [Baekduia sp.]|uniref:RNA polymerase sigma factor n=1 Tax=Baekduia sp. TaxID=2600305 RepID=UPI002D79F392|nr:RNA polymerase sigma factor [Baekduia sp.]HET6508367.1 RNA polymerase sigma factor [Baekduia sp.]
MFYERWEGPILAWLQRRTRDPEVAVDLSGEVFAAALSAADRFIGAGSGSAAAWLFTIARNTLLTSIRRGRVEEQARRRLITWEPVHLHEVDLDAIVELAADGPALMAALEQLPPRQREAVRARVLEERPYEEIAQQLACSEMVVRKSVSRGLKALRARMKDQPS